MEQNFSYRLSFFFTLTIVTMSGKVSPNVDAETASSLDKDEIQLVMTSVDTKAHPVWE